MVYKVNNVRFHLSPSSLKPPHPPKGGVAARFFILRTAIERGAIGSPPFGGAGGLI